MMKEKEEKRVPQLRFPEFTDDWEQRKLGEVADLITGYPFESKNFTNDGVKLVRGMNVKRGYLDFSDEICEHWRTQEGLENYLLEKDDILIQMDGALIGKSYAKIAENQLPALLVQRVTRVRTNVDKANEAFIYQEIQRNFLQYIQGIKTETAVPHLSLNDIANFIVAFPSTAEQKQIGNIFDTLDHLITLHQRKLEKLKELRKGVMKKLFNQEVRFKADDESEFPEWEKKKIGDVFSKIKDKNKDGRNQNVITNSAEFGLINQRDFFDKDIAVDGKTENYTVIKTGDFVYNPRKSKQAPYGPFNCYQLEENGIVSPLYTCLRPKSNVNDKYLLWYFKSGSWYRFIYENGAQNGARHDRVGMTDSLMQEIPVYLPQAVEEQQKIAECLSALDDVIEKQKATLAAWEELKKGLLQQMFV